jgi:hypothetical protein
MWRRTSGRPDAGQPSDGAGATPRIVEDVVAPLAEAEAAWRESLRDGPIATLFECNPASLPEYDDRIGGHDAERLRLLRPVPEKVAR